MTSPRTLLSSRSAPEWVTFAVSLVVLLAVVGLLVAQMRDGSGPADPRAVVVEADIEARGDRFAVPVRVTNEGDRGAQSVQVTAELVVGEEVTDADQTIDFLGADESVTLVFMFDEDPSTGELTVTVDGFTEP